MNPNKALWEKGDFTRIAECGDGATALPEARLGAAVSFLRVTVARN